MFSYFLILSFISAKCPKTFCSHWISSEVMYVLYYHGKNIKCDLSVSFKQLQSVQITIDFLKICSLYRPLLIKHLCVNQISGNSLDEITSDILNYNKILFRSNLKVLLYLFSLQNSQILSLQLWSGSRLSQFKDFK